ncbi:baseplate J/gp47 family protein [Cohnella nanjingensis]|uniref:Baseplate J/gp47 family protein n=1 Tax=Cohnella nanjingensis TaxID=1387779 RepID=A0A7X0RT47_9BACL|nr:baseplate J/gp47 family protein [Cohnella nanjingensis]MBB6673026.1 baseplate J/gp47 family protein [Cohnella nanjingensis]
MAKLPEYLSEQNEEDILSRMLSRVPSDVDKSEGSFIWDSLSPASFELFTASLWAQQVLQRAFASTAFGPYLDLRCEEHGVTRRPAVAAIGTVQFSGVAGTAVPIGTRVATLADPVTSSASIEYETTKTVSIAEDGTATVEVKAVEPGARGNVAASAISLMITPMTGISTVSNAAATSGGTDVESDASLLERFLIRVRSPGTSGNKADYILWALEVPGVGGVQILPLWNGPGTVKVTLLDSAKRSPNAALVAAVQKYIAPAAGTGEGKAPIGANVTVAAATEVPINVSVKVTLAVGFSLSEVRDLFVAGTVAYLQGLAFKDTLVRWTRISAILLDIPPVVDYTDLVVNGGTVNVEMMPGQVAVIGAVTMNAT